MSNSKNMLVPIPIFIKYLIDNNLLRDVVYNINLKRIISGPISQEKVGDAFVEISSDNGMSIHFGGQYIKCSRYEFKYECLDKYYFNNILIDKKTSFVSGLSIEPSKFYNSKILEKEFTIWYDIARVELLKFYLEDDKVVSKRILENSDKINKACSISINSLEEMLDSSFNLVKKICNYYGISDIELLRFYKKQLEEEYKNEVKKLNDKILNLYIK